MIFNEQRRPNSCRRFTALEPKLVNHVLQGDGAVAMHGEAVSEGVQRVVDVEDEDLYFAVTTTTTTTTTKEEGG